MNPVPAETVVERLTWRYATKKFDAARRIASHDWAALEAALVLAPSSWGLQPWRFIVVTDAAVKARLVAASWNQRQVADCSHHVVFAIRKGLSAADADRHLRRVMEVRGVPEASLAGFRKVLVEFVSRPAEAFDLDAWSAKQVYLALGQFMAAAAMLGIDTCPMEGLDPAAYDAILGLPPSGYATVVACCAGYRAVDDRAAAMKKVRFPADEVIARV